MSKIRILPEQLANQIAAGEVVERPASVVKELIENSLDAGASRIEVEIEGGGTRMIRVIDNGEGMDEDDLLMSLERHGTSKIYTVEDLGGIRTLGFRGEAIPSIGSVSQLTITSRQAQSELGTQVVLHYGKLLKVHDFGCSFGTTFEVRNLFGNTPARRKFLRTVRTEISHIDEVIKSYCLCSPHVTFILRINDKETVHLDKSLSIEQRLRNLLHYQGPLITIDTQSKTMHKYTLSGYIIPPEQVSRGGTRLRLMVNGRAVKDQMISHGVTEGLRGFLMKGKNPSGLIQLSLPPGEIDVNVHPAKHEVRFRQAQDVHAFLSSAVGRAIQEYQQTLKAHLFGADTNIQEPAASLKSHHLKQTDNNPLSQLPPTSFLAETRELEPILKSEIKTDSKPYLSGSTQDIFANAHPIKKSEEVENGLLNTKMVVTSQRQIIRHNLIVIGQFDNLYIFCKSSEGLLVIDQHAAHERLLYEKLRIQYLASNIVRQTLMFPETIELSLFQAQLVEKYGEELNTIGFSIREFGGNTFILSAVPALAGTINPSELFFDILLQFGNEHDTRDKGGLLDTVLATVACKAAVKAGTALSRQEIDKLLDEMVKADLFSHCPHGRPVVKFFSTTDVKKWFYRT